MQGLGLMSLGPKLSEGHPIFHLQNQELVEKRNELSDRMGSPGVRGVKGSLRQHYWL